MADRPARLKARVNANAVVLILALASSIGADGIEGRIAPMKVSMTVKMFNSFGIGQYAPGSSSCADADTDDSRKASAATARRFDTLTVGVPSE